ncbi:MAG: hypothetical protein K9M99_06125 [Candidatus Cloacimonetes bacterium]|nr:hypothetical protein [Candidatus Cloacimonadota bacterium]
MKRLILILLFLVLASNLFSQVAYFGIGYNVSRGEYEGFNYAIDRYNETRDYLTDEMDHINLTHGMSFEVGYAAPGFLCGMAIQYNRAKVEAKGIINDQKIQRDLKLHELNIPFEFAIPSGENGFAFAPGIGLNLMLWKYLTRTGEVNEIDDKEYYESFPDVGMHAKLFIKFIFGGVEDSGIGLVVEPYYNLGFLDSEMWTLNEMLNPNTYSNDPHKVEKFNQFGIKLSMFFKAEV